MKKGMTLIEKNRTGWTSLCQEHDVTHLYLFGSALTNHFDQNEQSDLDFVVALDSSLDPLEHGEHLLQLWNGLEALFQRPVDLLTEKSLSNPFLKRQIDATKYLLYERSGA